MGCVMAQALVDNAEETQDIAIKKRVKSDQLHLHSWSDFY